MASLTLVAILSWFLGRAIMGVYWVVIDSVMMCFFYDSERDNSLPVSDRIQVPVCLCLCVCMCVW